MNSFRSLFSKGTNNNPAPSPPLVRIEPRVSQASDSRKPSLTCLGNEILAIIADLLQDTSPSTIPSLALVCSNYYRVARYAQHRHVVLDNTKGTQMLEYIEKSGIPEAIRHLEVRDKATDALISKLCKVIPKMTGLKHVTWSTSGIPVQVLQRLQKRPSITLHTMIYHYHGRCQPDILESLQANKNLVSLQVDITYHNAEECRLWAQLLKGVLLSCPNLRKLKIDLSLPRGGCVMYGLPAEYCGFSFAPGERLPALEELDLREYPFGVPSLKDSPQLRFYRPYSQGYPLKVPERDYWADNFDWSRLTRLTTPDVQFALKIMPYLTSLKEFSCSNNHKDLKTFYKQVPSSLETITVPNVESIGLGNLLRHRSGLKKLTIHQEENYKADWRQAAIDAKTLIEIRDNCPHIEELGLDISRDGEWPYEILDILAGFRSLRFLKIWFELGIADARNPVQPYVRYSAVKSLFKYLREHAPGQTSQLVKLEIVSGCPPPLGYGLPSMSAFWPSHNSSSFICALSERDDEAERGVFSVSCPKLSPEENEDLQRVGDDGKEDLYSPFCDNEAFRIARLGPTPMRDLGIYVR
ncbi:hypothetical protein F5Y13DRAFT_162904 [Hypoxylon sp. FL1857]|nr:hypothetical protein F5Y13DRAFT_162904 [Hypoxylon sp. FL1857]